jgi:fructokinase
MAAAPSIIVVGEALWDGLPSGLYLGGAPCNVGVHLAQLGRSVAVATRVGRDQLGEEILSRLGTRGVDVSLIQLDDAHRTGFVRVVMTGSEPSYDIVRPSAWDFLEACEALTSAARTADALVFGSLAQREAASRDAIMALASVTRRAVFDVNLRPPFIDKAVVEASASTAWLLKLNADEAHQLAAWFGLPDEGDVGALARALGARFGCNTVVTCGGDGAKLWLKEQGLFTHAGCKVQAVDAVGAGDAFLASLLDGLLREQARTHHMRVLRVLVASADAACTRAGPGGGAGARQRGGRVRGDAARRDAAAGLGRYRQAHRRRAARRARGGGVSAAARGGRHHGRAGARRYNETHTHRFGP